jgi:uncharacterized protein (TIGR03790 family)
VAGVRRIQSVLISLVVLVCQGAVSLRAGNPGDQVVVVYNSRMPDSKGVAEYYAQRRRVPANQVFGFPLSTNEDISRQEFRDSLELPLAEALKAGKLWRIGSYPIPATTNHHASTGKRVIQSKIRYALLCYGVPLRISAAPHDPKEEAEEDLRPELRRNEAAVDSDLALLPNIEPKPRLLGLLRNPVYTTTNVALLDPTNGLLLVTRLDGPTAAIARGLVDKALEAETNGLWGRAYFDLRNTTEPGLKQGDEWIRGAADICRHLGFETVVDENPGTFPAGFPMSHIAIYIGWYDGAVSGPFTEPTVEFMPGAFAYHLHSYSAATLRSPSQNWAGPLLAKGATATMGCVFEPYLAGTPDMAIFTARLVFYGFTFGEAAYAAQPVSSWQTTVVGDPLYRPFGKNPDQLHLDLALHRSKWLEWSYLRLLNLNQAMGKPLASLVVLLDQLELTKKSAVLTEKLGDLYVAQGKPSSAVHEYTRALQLETSPQQRLRLRLTLGEKLAALDRAPEAYAEYQALLKERPQYPDKLGIYKKLLPLAQKLNKKADAETYQAEINRLSPRPSKPPERNPPEHP